MALVREISRSGLSVSGGQENQERLTRRIIAASAVSAAAFALAAFAPCSALALDGADADVFEGDMASQELVSSAAHPSNESLVESLSGQIQRGTDTAEDSATIASTTDSAPSGTASNIGEIPGNADASTSYESDEVLYVADSSLTAPEAYLYTYEFNPDGSGQTSSVAPLVISGGTLTQTTGQPFVYSFSGWFTSSKASFFGTNPNSVNYGYAEYSVDGKVVSADNKYMYTGISLLSTSGLTNPTGTGSITPVYSGSVVTSYKVELNVTSDTLPAGVLEFGITFAKVTTRISFHDMSLDRISGHWENKPDDRFIEESDTAATVTFPTIGTDLKAPLGYSFKGWLGIDTGKDRTKNAQYYADSTVSISRDFTSLLYVDFYPVWESTSSPAMYSVTFADHAFAQPASEAGTWVNADIAHTFTGTAVTLVELPKQRLISDVYDFAGWAGKYDTSSTAITYQLPSVDTTFVQLAGLSYAHTGTFSMNFTLYPVWLISYMTSGNSGAFASSGATSEGLGSAFPGTGKAIVNGTLYTLPTATYTREGDTQIGWNTKPDGSGKSYALYDTQRGAYAMENRLDVPDFPLSSLVLYAQWASGAYLDDSGELAGNSITYVANGGQGDVPATVSGERNDVVTLAANTLERPGYTANGWNTKADGTGVAYADGADFTLNGATNLYAAWKAKIYTLTFDVNGGVGMSSSSVNVRADQKVSLPSTKPKRSGFLFRGWFYNNGDGVYVPVTGATTVAEIVAASKDTAGSEISIDALWGVASNAIIYMLNGATGGSVDAAPAIVDTAMREVAKNTFTRDGYVATGWNTERDGSGVAYVGGEAVTLTDNLTLWAQWSAADDDTADASALASVSDASLDFVVRYLLNGATGGSIFDGSTGTEDGANVILADNALTRSGYTASGWNTESDGSGMHYASGDIISLTSDLVLYAQWIEGDPVNEGGDASGMAPSGYTGDPTVWGASAASESAFEGWYGFEGGSGSWNAAERAYRALAGFVEAFAAAVDNTLHANSQDITASLRASAKDAVTGALDARAGAQNAQDASGLNLLTIFIAILAALAIILLILAILRSRRDDEEEQQG